MSLLEITGLCHAFGDHVLFRNAALALNKGEHVGVVGPNGAGKSTLIRICTGELVPDAGRVVWQPQVRVGCLDQHAAAEPSMTMRGFLRSAFAELYAAEDEMLRLYARSAQDEACLERAAALQTLLEQRDFYGIDTKIEQVASGLGLTAVGLSRPLGEMSGGQRAKAILAKLLLEEPDVLLLDEPTNFLDQAHVAWLADYLAGLRGAFLVVSHDYGFLQRISGAVCDVDHARIAKYYGSYADFVKKKALLRADYVRQYAQQQRKIEETEAFIRKNRAGIKSKMARGRQKQLDRMERLETPEQDAARPRFRFQALPAPSTEQLAVRGLSVGYHYPVLSQLSFSVRGGERLVVTDFNGVGKSTLLKTLVGQLFLFRTGSCGVLRAGARLAGPCPHAARACGGAVPVAFRERGAPLPRAVRRFGEARDAAGGHALGRRAGEGKALPACTAAAQLFDFGRADEPPRRAGQVGAWSGARGVSGHSAARVARGGLLPGLGFARDRHQPGGARFTLIFTICSTHFFADRVQ